MKGRFPSVPCHFSLDAENIHVYPVVGLGQRTHEISGECWCEPEVDTMNEAAVVWVHREIQ